MLTKKQREAHRKHCRKWRKENPEKERKYRVAYREEHRKNVRKYEKNHPEKCREHARKYRIAHPEKIAAHKEARRLVKSGELVRPDSCSICGNNGRIEGHHEDYTRPEKVQWVCPECHMKIHRGQTCSLTE